MPEREFTEFVETRWAKLVRSARLLGLSSEDAEDVAQAALVACWLRWRKAGNPADRDAYCYRTLVNKARRSKRRSRDVLTRSTLDASHDDQVLPSPSNEDPFIAFALASLRYEQRQVLVCRYYLDLDLEATAAVLQIPVGTVKSRQSRALTAMASTYRSQKESAHSEVTE